MRVQRSLELAAGDWGRQGPPQQGSLLPVDAVQDVGVLPGRGEQAASGRSDRGRPRIAHIDAGFVQQLGRLVAEFHPAPIASYSAAGSYTPPSLTTSDTRRMSV